jgi:hypothetical protein
MVFLSFVQPVATDRVVEKMKLYWIVTWNLVSDYMHHLNDVEIRMFCASRTLSFGLFRAVT